MPADLQTLRHVFAGGWATDNGPTAEAFIQSDGLIRIPFLIRAENCYFELDGAPHKIGGTELVNSSVIESGEELRAGIDYWKMGVAGSPTQKRVVAAGTKILKDDADGTFSAILTGLDDDAIITFAVFDDVLFICSSSTTNLPRYYDGTTAGIVQSGTSDSSAVQALDDGTFSGAWTSDTQSELIEVQIITNGTPDKFRWRVDGGAWSSNTDITGAAQALTNGISITFGATTGHSQAFSGAGLDDGTYTGTFSGSAASTIEVEIDANGTPDTFRWRQDVGAWTAGVAITGGAQALADGISITFGATTGHTIGDKWTFDSLEQWDYTIGLAPNLSFMVEHLDRMWGGGNPAAPEKMFYSVFVDPMDWNGSGSGEIQCAPGDGDRTVGAVSHKRALFAFKGPYRGSIHRITGTSPSDFARETFVRGIGAVHHNLIFTFADDVGFVWSDGTIRSLAATAAFGDFQQKTLSVPIHSWLQEHVNVARLAYGWAEDFPTRGRVMFTMPIDSSSDNNFTLSMDYRFNPPRLSRLPSIKAGCIFRGVDPQGSNSQTMFAGGNDGFLRKLDRSTRAVDGSGIGFDVLTPSLNYSDPKKIKVLYFAALALATRGNSEVIFSWQRDEKAQQQQSVSQSGGDVLAPAASDLFVLDASVLSGDGFKDRFLELFEGGEFRSIRYGVRNSGVGEDVELHAISATIGLGSDSLENE